MPGTIVFKPIEANLVHNTDFITKMNPYCAFVVDGKRYNSQICKHGGKHPHWNDSIAVPVPSSSHITIELMDKDRITKDDVIGTLTVEIPELQAQGLQSRWYPLQYKNKPAGEILIEASFEGLAGSEFIGQQAQSGLLLNQQPSFGVIQREEAIIEQPAVVQEEVIVKQTAVEQEAHQTFVEQRQTVEPRTFIKEVDVVETRPVLKEVEVFEPRKVLKTVQYTEAVPVKKLIDTADVQVVMKEVEVMEPRLVTKTIQVVENVPVTKQVEVIESVSSWKEVEVFEPQTFTKQVQVTEQVPVMKTVTVTEPVHLKRAVEFVEPIITTKTITKEIKPEVIVDEKVTKSVGPATYLREITELSQRFSQVTLTEQERLRYLNISEQQQVYLSEEEKWRWHEARRLSSGNQFYSSQGVSNKLGSAEKKHHHSLFHKRS